MVLISQNYTAGESNLKVRRPLNIKGAMPESPEAVARMSVTLACEPPNNNLHYFIGRAVVQVSLCWRPGGNAAP